MQTVQDTTLAIAAHRAAIAARNKVHAKLGKVIHNVAVPFATVQALRTEIATLHAECERLQAIRAEVAN